MSDVRLDKRGDWFVDRIVATHSLVLKTVGGDRAGEAAINRYLGHEAVTPDTILAPHVARTRAAVQGRRVVVAQDTTEVNFAGRARRRKDLGPGGDGVSPGFFSHPQIVVDVETEAVLGIAGCRALDASAGQGRRPAQAHARGQGEPALARSGADSAGSVLAGAAQIIVVGDRESDIYGLFAARPDTVDLVVRAAQDRALADGTCLKAAAAAWPVLARANVAVAAQAGRRRKADRTPPARPASRCAPARSRSCAPKAAPPTAVIRKASRSASSSSPKSMRRPASSR